MIDDLAKKRAVLKFCEGLFATRNLIPTDFDDVEVTEVKGRDFPQQSDGAGLHVTFSVSWHALGKTRGAHGVLKQFFPDWG